jgi:hypothetical protein
MVPMSGAARTNTRERVPHHEASSNHIAFKIANAQARPNPNIQLKYHMICPQ